MATEARYGWELPDLGDVADGPFAFKEFADDVSATIANTAIQSYSPQWASLGGQQPGNTSSREGKYAVRNGWCDVSITLEFGPGVSGGTKQLYLTLPVAASTAIKTHFFQAVLFSPGYGWWQGWAYADGGVNRVYPYFAHPTVPGLTYPWENAPESGQAGAGTPRINGTWAVANTGNLRVTGRYYVG